VLHRLKPLARRIELFLRLPESLAQVELVDQGSPLIVRQERKLVIK
jgi:hypothetical protein